ncbi:tetratricopeptide repeat protein [Desulfopila inferna]|uniref:tetratricopeptide repeat protein n=1 Tax=Desulfopila inferna TaxID=468528 RepID=UPI001965C32B|nr:tetratricopeptide repeat protein [Desulfopila inferna]MBM9602925.1 tetratricopeptide repeat protein [Desulfopila inferna]
MNQKARNSELENIFTEAVAFHQSGNLEEACRMYLSILAIHDSPLVNYNLGLAYYELERYEDSCRCYTKALEHAPEEIDVLYNLALSLKQLNLFDETIITYKKILSLNAEEIDSLYNLACCYKDTHQDDKAIALYLHVLDLDENNQSALNNVAFLYHKNDDYFNAKKYYSRLLRINPEHHGARHMLSSLHGENRHSAPPEYIREIFDAYSAHYDISLVSKLEYSVPSKLRQIYDHISDGRSRSLAGLDLGCGTGLGGEAFAGLCSTFTGVDISEKMIEVAAGKNIYSALYISEIHDFLEDCLDRYSLVLATDVFNYIGELQYTFEAINKAAQSGACLCFSTEISFGSGYDLRKTGRFAHSPEYIQNICRLTGWKICSQEKNNLRKDKGRWVEGILYLVRK